MFRNTIMALEAVRGGSLFLLVQGGRLRRRLTQALGRNDTYRTYQHYKATWAKILYVGFRAARPWPGQLSGCARRLRCSQGHYLRQLLSHHVQALRRRSHVLDVGLVQWCRRYILSCFRVWLHPWFLVTLSLFTVTLARRTLPRPNKSFEADGFAAAQFQR
jgi:hypothetical protein